MTAFVALFRGINVGGRKVKMDKLKDLHESLGLRHVKSHIQSGNILFTSDSADSTQLGKQIEDVFAQSFGFHSDVIVRSSAELSSIIDKNPFQGQQDKKSQWVVVIFLAACPDDIAREALLKAYTGPEELFVIGKELYVYYAEGIGRSKLTLSFIERKLKTIGTARNWNTILQLQELIQR
ncbi:MAG TPA: DUF1697 domain-containing protein [Ktedonobacteraceae bacterium]